MDEQTLMSASRGLPSNHTPFALTFEQWGQCTQWHNADQQFFALSFVDTSICVFFALEGVIQASRACYAGLSK